MSPRKLLCICPDGMAAGLEASLLPGWDVCVAGSLREAARMLRARRYLVGLILGLIGDARHAALEQFLREHWSVQWIGVCTRDALEAAPWRELVLEHLCDFHTCPVDAERLRHTLGHAYGLAMLREQAAPQLPPAPLMTLAGTSAAIVKLRAQIAKVAGADAPVLIWGESGSGKELTAQAIHAQSRRAKGPFVPINCGAIPPTLIQSELFGHERGAFTGAARDKAGLIESAAGGTVFLDEIADLPKDLQSNLLRFLQEKTIYRVGSTRSIEVDARVIAASHVDLQQAVARGMFREDLYYRLNVLPIDVPPLRARADDLAMLAEHFFQAHAADKAPRLKGFSSQALRAIRQHDWPGNVRELINRTRRAMVLAEGRLIGPHDLGLAPSPDAAQGAGLDASRLQAERLAIGASLERAGRNITHAARELGVSRMTLYRLLAKHGIAP
ncbi:MAG: sigma-54 dependent transcriptional regulator [Telluria sp.]|nr:sigma-54 dependent transcriptional regulator [Telluria sp.]